MYLRERLLELLDSMFHMDIRHFAATLLHPKYRQLRGVTNSERDECHAYVRQQLKLVAKSERSRLRASDSSEQPVVKRTKVSFLERYEDHDISDEYDEFDDTESIIGTVPDELQRYLALQIDKSTLSSNPLDFWKDHQTSFPMLSRFARRIHSIPATTAAVERQFSGAGLVVSERRTNLNPAQIDNVLLVRSVEKSSTANTVNN